ncbi:MAG: DNA methyltransferase [Acidiferrobacterales bacterium]|nr:DNA methyltransferase [Acidiferrobacterales bacterium]
MTDPKREAPTRKPANFASGTIWTGDNLPIMRGMNSESVDLIYLDPPFNSNKNYSAPIGSEAAGAAFKDTWTLSDIDVHEHGELADRNPAAYSVIEASRQAHGKGMMSYLIFMAVRLLEMKRILKPTGSIYLHCDPTASHYLKLLLDGIFERANFRNEIVWKRTSGHSDSKTMGSVHDVILHQSISDALTYNVQYVAYSKEYVKRRYRHQDPDGRRFMDGDLTAKGLQSGGYVYEYRGTTAEWRVPFEKMKELDRENRLYFTNRGGIRIKRYLDEMKGVPINDVWTDIDPINSRARERIGYPTQKPLALLERIIRASSNIGDMVFDPFCGCATTLVAADRLQRQWAGIDLSPLAIKLVNERISEDRGLFGGATSLNTAPVRTDLGKLPNYRTHRHRLYGEQEGVCTGCETHFPFRVMDVDHILPKSRGGTDHPDNLQLLCSGCNRSKGGKTMAEWRSVQ